MSLVQDWEKIGDYDNGVTLHFSRQSSMVKVAVNTDSGELSQEVGPFDTAGISGVASRLRSGHVRFDADANRRLRYVVASLGLIGRRLG
ncbi:MAG TPA: hypothetical protein PKH37_02340 [Alphaproteobacteria bacterium]|nr:hypothetical protein [Alphaproteobacteria bacterium]